LITEPGLALTVRLPRLVFLRPGHTVLQTSWRTTGIPGAEIPPPDAWAPPGTAALSAIALLSAEAGTGKMAPSAHAIRAGTANLGLVIRLRNDVLSFIEPAG
jgi:hypothetical protein